MSATHNKSKEPEKATGRAHRADFQPLKVCAKHNPPMIAILYVLANNQTKQYLHEIPLPTRSPQDKTTALEMYRAMAKSEPIYLDPHVVSPQQIVRLLEQIMGQLRVKEKDIDTISDIDVGLSQPEAKDPAQKETDNIKEKSEKEDVYVEDFLDDDLPLEANPGKTKEAPAAQKESDTEPVAEKQSELAEPAKEKGNKDEEIDYEKMDAAMEKEELPEGFQRVFVEDLGQELLMDPEGNLYDMNGNVIGQAESEEETAQPGNAGAPAGGEDDRYFEDSADKKMVEAEEEP